MILHRSINIILILLTGVWCAVTKSQIILFVFLLWVKAEGLEAKLTSNRHLSIIALG